MGTRGGGRTGRFTPFPAGLPDIFFQVITQNLQKWFLNIFLKKILTLKSFILVPFFDKILALPLPFPS